MQGDEDLGPVQQGLATLLRELQTSSGPLDARPLLRMLLTEEGERLFGEGRQQDAPEAWTALYNQLGDPSDPRDAASLMAVHMSDAYACRDCGEVSGQIRR